MRKIIRPLAPLVITALKICGLIGVIVVITSCASADLDDYASNQPVLDPRTFFDGNLKAYGVVKKRNGDINRYFTATINASWEENIGTLDELFYFDDGEVQKRVWTLEQQNDGGYLASANDVVGIHPMAFSGNALFMEYVLQIPYKGRTLNVTVDDKMFLVDENRIINESVLYKWGFKVASVQLVIEKL